MTTTTPATRPTGALTDIRRGDPISDRLAAARTALELVDDPRCERPVPRFMLHLPWSASDEEVIEGIIASMLASDDPEATQANTGTTKAETLLGRAVTVWDLRVLPSDMAEGWGAYLLMDVTVDDEAEHFPVASGARQAVARIAKAYVDDGLPVRGAFVQAAAGKGGHSAPLTFVVERPLTGGA